MRIRAAVLLAAACACTSMTEQPAPFASDATFLETYAGGILIESGTGAFVVSPKLQGRVMTSTTARGGTSLGFVNHQRILHPDPAAPFQNFGGEDRLWIGPEGGRYSLYFAPGEELTLQNWRVPADLDSGAFRVRSQGRGFVDLEREVRLRNRLGTAFELRVERRIEAPRAEEVLQLCGGALPAEAEWVAFRSRNRVTNAGRQPWFRETGLPCVWILGMFRAAPRTWVIAPFRDAPGAGEEPVQSGYFGAVGPDRLRRGGNFVLFRADARHRSKIGLYQARAMPVLGAYDPDAGLLTLVRFGPIDRSAPYLNELWDPEHPEPYHGDVANAYNHGGPEPFFELESSSPALALDPGAAHEHEHLTVHLRLADEAELARVAAAALGVDWAEVRRLGGW